MLCTNSAEAAERWAGSAAERVVGEPAPTFLGVGKYYIHTLPTADNSENGHYPWARKPRKS